MNKPRLPLALLLAASLIINPAFAAEDKPAYPTFKTASGFSRAVQNVTGFTLVSGWVANHIIRKELKKHVQGDLHSRLTLFSGSDLLGGKAKSLRISGHNVLLDGFIPLSEFRFENRSDMPLCLYKSSRPFLLRPVTFKISAVLSEDDLNRMLQSEKGRKMLTGMKVTIPPFGLETMDAMQPSVHIDGDRVVLQSLMNMHDAPPENALPVKVSGKIAAEKSTLKLSELNLEIEGIQDTEEIEQLIENYFSDLVNLNHIKIARHKVKTVIDKSELADRKLTLEATLTVEPDRKTLQKALAAMDKGK